MRGFYRVAFMEYVIAGKCLLNYTNLFSPNNYQKNDKTNLAEETLSLDFRLKK